VKDYNVTIPWSLSTITISRQQRHGLMEHRVPIARDPPVPRDALNYRVEKCASYLPGLPMVQYLLFGLRDGLEQPMLNAHNVIS